MNLRWRFSGGILFSLTIHAFLLTALLYAYPGIISKSEWIWKELPTFSAEKMTAAVSSFENADETFEILSADNLIFPDLILISNPKKKEFVVSKKQKKPEIVVSKKLKKEQIVISDQPQKPQKQIVTTPRKQEVPKPKFTLNNILTQVGQFPERLIADEAPKKQLSSPVISLLSRLPNVSIQRKAPENKVKSFNVLELKKYLKGLNTFLSERWEVPIHLKESQLTVAIRFEINKNGKILNWKLEESGSSALHNSVSNLMKNLQFLPALPKSYPEDSYKFGVRFSPTILQK